MKQLKTIMGVLTLFAVLSCSKNTTGGVGYVVFEVSGNDNVADCTRSNVSDYTNLPSTDAFIIKVQDSESSVVYQGLVSEWNSTAPLKAGEYTVTASYGSLEEEGFDKPYFVGTESFTVTGGEETSVKVPVALGNTIVKMGYSESFRNYYKDYTFTVLRGGKEVVKFSKDETRAAFLDGYKFQLKGVLEGEMKTYDFVKDCVDMEAATAYTFYFDVTNVGGSSITITFKEGYTETIELGDYELND